MLNLSKNNINYFNNYLFNKHNFMYFPKLNNETEHNN